MTHDLKKKPYTLNRFSVKARAQAQCRGKGGFVAMEALPEWGTANQTLAETVFCFVVLSVVVSCGS